MEALSIDEVMLTDEHPEPELLALSVGKEIDGRMIPSLSTISLLSLNQDSCQTYQTVAAPQPARVLPQMALNPQMQPIKPPLTSRNSTTRLGLRLQTYRLPTPGNANLHSQLQGGGTAAIPIRGGVPDSPMLDPTSVGGLPSRFWLSSQTPPRSLGGSYKQRTHVMPMLQIQPVMPEPIYAGKGGGSSPILYPVQTPSEDPPMTPLYLNGDGYFALVRIPEGMEMEMEEEREESVED